MLKLTSAAVVAVSLAIGGNALATPVYFDLAGGPDSYVSLSNISTGLSTSWGRFGTDTNISATLASDLDDQKFTLLDGGTATIDFFTLSVSGSGIGWFDIEARLAFDPPSAFAVVGDGAGGWGTLNLGINTFSGGVLSWDNSMPQTFLLADGNSVTVDLESGIALGASDTATVHAYITNNGGGVAPIPEPRTMLLLGTGLVGLASFGRKLRKGAG